MPSRTVCFVCGNIGADLQLSIKQKDKGPYFPFLEQHEPPKGSRLPREDGTVDSCTVCFAFLRQQWEAYERNKTPAIKRLYWLKRSDNGHFTGAEMKFQGEYMAQVMGLQYQSNDNYEPVSPDDAGYSRESYSRSQTQPAKSKPTTQAQSNPDGALDLSVPSKPPETSKHLSSSKVSTHSNKDCFVCFTCAYEKPLASCKIVSAIRHAPNEPYFPFLEKLSPPRGSTPMNSQGVTRVCSECFESLISQWLSYERAGTPTSARLYKVKDNYIGLSSSLSAEVPKREKVNASEICYLCGQPWPSGNVKPLFTSGSKMHFPFIRELRRPQGARPLNPDGSVLCCNNCHNNLQTQWHHYELERISPLQRRYSLLPVNGRDAFHVPPHSDRSAIEDGESSNSKSSLKSSDITQPLNIHISKSPQQPVTGNHGLLAIAPQASAVTENTNSNSVPYSSSPSKADRNLVTVDAKGQPVSATTIPHPLQQASALPKKICFICGEKSLITKAHTLFSYPTRPDIKSHNSIVLPFFPFLVNRDPAPNSDPMTDDGTVISCTYCFHSLLVQWKDYEESKNPADQNRWLRKYFVSDFICYVCGKSVTRSKIRTLEVYKFPFLKEHKAPPFSLILDNGEGIAACDTCAYDLMHQNTEYERMGVPVELRKYNWMPQPTNIEDISNDGCDQVRSESQIMVDEENNPDSQSQPGRRHYIDSDGLVQGSKPPPLTMLSPAGSKLARNTATVPPLNQVSPSNGLTSVSNNTALNATHEAIKHSSPNSTNSSPRSTTPKRAPPPLVYSSQSSTLTSPPVVTIAPTPSHQSALATDMRHGMDRIPSAHSTSSNYEPLALKQERDQRPLSRHSREDERVNKDGQALSHSARITPHSNPGAGLLPTSREESLARGFQPYRHGEEIRPPVPSGFGMDPAYAAYHSALLASHYSHPAYRFEDPLLLERYRMMQPSFMPFSHPGMMAHPGVHPLLAGSRYPPELLHQYPYISPSAAQGLDPRSPALSAERARLEEERQREIDREKEKDREKEREKEKWREKEREKEVAQRMREHDMERERERAMERLKLEHERREYLAQNSAHDAAHRSDHHREDLSAPKFGSITQGTPRDAMFSDKYKQAHHSQRTLLESRHDNHHKTPAQVHESRNLSHHRESSRNSIPLDAHRRHEHNHRSESDHSRGHPPPLISPKEPGEIAQHRPDNGLFRPFEKESRSAYPHLEVPNLHNRKTELTVPPLKIPHREGHADVKQKSYSNERSQVHGTMHSNMAAYGSLSNHTKENYSLKRLVNDINKNSKLMTDEVSHDSVPNHVTVDKPKVHVPVSKLDKEEERLRKARLNGTYVSDDEEDDWSEKEEDRIERMMLIRSGPPLQLDKSPAKIKFLSGLGLYTIQKKKDKEFERFKKRRKLFREKSLSPIIVEEERKIGSPLTIPKIDPDLLCIESDYPTKCSFLSSFNLQQLERDKRKELCMIREACVLEKKRRLGIDDSQTQEETISPIKKEKGIKRKRGENSSLEMNTSENVKLTLGQLQQRHLAAQQNKLNNIHNKVTDNRAVIFPETRDRGKILSREFAEQFHESVLQTTRQKELASRLGNTRSDEGPNQTTENTSSTHPRYHVTSDGIGTSSLSDQSDSSSFKWPGITAVMEAYQRHAEEQRTEHGVLSDRCKKLQADNRDLNKAAEKLSNRMSSLLEKKQQYEDDRNRTQGAIENLKKSLRCLR